MSEPIMKEAKEEGYEEVGWMEFDTGYFCLCPY